jgi:hypothetical protein
MRKCREGSIIDGAVSQKTNHNKLEVDFGFDHNEKI